MHTGSSTWRPLAMLGGFVSACMLATSTVTIEPGDTLSQIAREHRVSVADLVAWNGLDDPDRIIAGNTLLLASPTQEAASVDRPARYTIAPGDTLSAVAARFGLSVAHLVAANDLDDPNRIIAGTTLELSAGESPRDATVPPSSAGSYTVVAGDTLSAIAATLGTSTTALARINRLRSPDRIYIGQILDVDEPTATRPGPTTTAPPPPTPAPSPGPEPDAGPGSGTSSDEPLSNLFARWSEAYALPRDLLEALLWKESDWRPDAVGPGGHLGIGQLSPGTVEFVETHLLGRDMDPLDADDGIQMAARFLRYLLDRTADEREALAAWNQGLWAVQNHGVSAPGGAFADAVLEIRRRRD